MTLRSIFLFPLAALVLAAAVLVGASPAAHACSCADLTPAQAVGHADAVFTGTVVNVQVGDGDPFGPRPPAVYRFRADNVYKGAPAAEFTLASDLDGASCGYKFEPGTRYLVFAQSGTSGAAERAPGVSLSSSLCSGNIPVEAGTGLLRPGDERRASHESWSGPVDAALIAALGPPVKAGRTSAAPSSPQPTAAPPADRGTPVAGPGRPVAGVAVASAALVAALAAGLLLPVLRARRRRSGSAQHGDLT
ncbi:hypothetical protein [Nonomuraea zeae]|uniref:Tissue inhibitor of metalloproteinase n=1 Tax=Nonomuraea zeae TaxID=1642303 RepID=A0A5S4G5T6_9ACTN|nr:hypothetical protein [Nonomuraea zeae]TMR28202.1 hypothetical protein ETD85_36605 [Nonomuraea zeae]